MPKLSIIIPVYNEIATLDTILDRVLAVDLSESGHGVEREIVLVDDCSRDGSRAKLEQMRDHPDGRPLVFAFHERNQGKGAAIRTGLDHVSGDMVMIQDADLEYSPEEIPKLIKPILDGLADVVYGSRFTGKRRVFMFSHHVGNKLLTFITNVLYGANLTDMETCYKVFRTKHIRSFGLQSSRFNIEPEITAKVFRSRLRVYELPISYDGRSFEEGKKITWRDGFSALWTLMRYRFWVNRTGEETLHRISKMRRFNKWIYDTILPHLGMRVLEAGCGTGSFTDFLRGRELVHAIDPDEVYIETLTENHRGVGHVTFEQASLPHVDVEALREKRFDTVVCLNVLEHIREDEETLRVFHDLLVPGGRAIIYVPAHPFLFCGLDEALEHHRRYTRDELERKMREAGFEILESRHQNVFGTIGWFINGKILRRRLLPSRQLSVYESLVPVFRGFERMMGRRPPFGLSVFAVGQRPKTDA
ncbi:glycosyltransferase [Candidatus Sumerlaeota bacterium]|nr:glycosyltransferase [Candidatus Sumerlaeota bacterium]